MTEQEALHFIHEIDAFGSKPGLERVRALLARMGNPQKRLRFVHVAGTNGKGSTCTMLSAILTAAGYRTGLYISPFVVDFRERIQVDNRMISGEELAACTEVVKAHWEALAALGDAPSEFEVVVAAAMEYFTRRRCDIVVLEVGMGGRFDATNIIDVPLCAVITAISMDHMQYLGDTLPKIAFEKCGIIKPGGDTVSYPLQDPEVLAVIMERCAQENNRLYMPNPAGVQLLEQSIDGSRIRCGEMELRILLGGAHQVYNALTVLEAVRVLRGKGLDIGDAAVREGLAATRFAARLEVLCREPLVLLDGAHNRAGARALGEALRLLGGRRIHAVAGMLRDKEVDASLAEVLPLCASVTAVEPPGPRAMPAGEFARVAERYCADVTVCAGRREAVERALERCGTDGVMVIFGSLYHAGELRGIVLELTL